MIKEMRYFKETDSKGEVIQLVKTTREGFSTFGLSSKTNMDFYYQYDGSFTFEAKEISREEYDTIMYLALSGRSEEIK